MADGSGFPNRRGAPSSPVTSAVLDTVAEVGAEACRTRLGVAKVPSTREEVMPPAGLGGSGAEGEQTPSQPSASDQVQHPECSPANGTPDNGGDSHAALAAGEPWMGFDAGSGDRTVLALRLGDMLQTCELEPRTCMLTATELGKIMADRGPIEPLQLASPSQETLALLAMMQQAEAELRDTFGVPDMRARGYAGLFDGCFRVTEEQHRATFNAPLRELGRLRARDRLHQMQRQAWADEIREDVAYRARQRREAEVRERRAGWSRLMPRLVDMPIDVRIVP